MPIDRDLYTVLGVPPEASQEEIRDAYLRVSRVVHPDRFDSAKQPLEWKQANQMLRDANSAYAVLRDPQERAKYDGARSRVKTPEKEQQPKPKASSASAKTSDSSANQKTAHGESRFGLLPNHLKEILTKRQQGGRQDQCVLQTEGIGWKYLGVLVGIGWLANLGALAGDTRWDDSTLIVLLTATGAVALLCGWCFRWIWTWHRSALKCHLYVTPLYIIQTKLDVVRWWPLWTLDNLKTTHNYRNGSYQNTDLKLTFPSGTISFVVSPRQTLETWMKSLDAFGGAMREAARNADWNYFEQRNEFGGVKSQKVSKKRESQWTLVAMGISLLASGLMFVTAYNINATESTMTGNPPRSSAAGDSSALNPVVPRNQPDQSLKSIPPRMIGKGSSSVPEPTISFKEPVQALPVNGYMTLHTQLKAVAPLEIRTRDGLHYFVKLVDLKTGSTVLTIFIRAGQSVETNVPLGSYQIRYATGTSWFGEEYLFGPDTSYSKAESQFDFVRDGTEVRGYTVELFLQTNGNLNTSRIRPDQW